MASHRLHSLSQKYQSYLHCSILVPLRADQGPITCFHAPPRSDSVQTELSHHPCTLRGLVAECERQAKKPVLVRSGQWVWAGHEWTMKPIPLHGTYAAPDRTPLAPPQLIDIGSPSVTSIGRRAIGGLEGLERTRRT